MRACEFCGAPLEGRRRHARFCGGPCRAAASRVRRLLAGEAVDGYRTLADWRRGPRKRTGTAVRGT